MNRRELKLGERKEAEKVDKEKFSFYEQLEIIDFRDDLRYK